MYPLTAREKSPITDGMQTPVLSADDVRQHLIARAERYARDHRCSLSYIGEQAVSDGKFLLNVKGGANFTLRTYQRVIDWMDASGREAAE